MNISEIEIQTDNIEETTFFYSNVLGLKIKEKKPNSISLTAGQSVLTFIKSRQLQPIYHFAFNIPHNQLNEAILWASSRFQLLENNENGIIASFEEWNAQSIYFLDNNQNILELIARFDLDNSSEDPFDTSSIQSISEIGIVTDEPIKLADRFIKEMKTNYFTKGGRSEKFASVGNDNGLLIIVETNRMWYPTDQKAEKHYTKIKIEVDHQIREIIINEPINA